MTFSQKQAFEILCHKKELSMEDVAFCLTVLRDNLPEVSCNTYTYECLKLILEKYPK